MKICGREYKIIKIYEKGNEIQDMFLCLDIKTGTRECFSRFDMKNEIGSFYASRKSAEI